MPFLFHFVNIPFVIIVVCGGGAKAEVRRIVIAVVRRSKEVVGLSSAFGWSLGMPSRFVSVARVVSYSVVVAVAVKRKENLKI